jgi:transglutaminase-like putative cysteine protease
MNYRYFLLLAVLAAGAPIVHAQSDARWAVFTLPPQWLLGVDAVVREQTVEFNVSAPDEAVLTEKRVVTLFNNDSDYDELVLHYNKFNKITRMKGALYDAGGNFIRDVEKKEIEDQSAISSYSIYEDSRVKAMRVSHDRYPYTVVFEYEVKFRDILYYPNWHLQEDFNTAVERAQCTVTMGPGLKLHYRPVNLAAEPVVRDLDKGRRAYTWSVANLPPIPSEVAAPPAAELLPYVLLAPDVFSADGYTGSMASWQSFGKFQYELARERDVLSPALKAKVREVCTGATTPRAKIAALYRYLQANTRYVSVQLGIGGWQPFDAAYVEKNRYGDCKALSNFMKALLREAGIAAYPALIRHGDDEAVDLPKQFAIPAFNHVIIYVPGEDLWLECTSQSLPPGYVGSGNDNRDVLLITEKGGELGRTPALAPSVNGVERRTDIALGPAGEANVEVRQLLRGEPHEWYRGAYDHLPAEELRREVEKRLSLPQAYFDRLQVRPLVDSPAVAIEYRVVAPKFGSKSGKRLFVPLAATRETHGVPADDPERVHPVVVARGYVELDTVVLQVPAGFRVENTPAETVAFGNEFGSYRASIRRADGRIVLERRLEVLPVRVPAARYADWRQFHKDVVRADNGKVVLVQE